MTKNRKRRILRHKIKEIAKKNISKTEATILHFSRRSKRFKTKFTEEGLIFL